MESQPRKIRIANGDQAGLEAFLGWLMNRIGAYAPKIVNPGGVELWKQKRTGNATDLNHTNNLGLPADHPAVDGSRFSS